ncbi:Peptide-methionine (S)-S-oxide reductase [Tulasnella sp. UAMH 9824]|nr:Peptide-methionine (S)-S-oxide reductase [Tulasnella sp. UAMH 9824]
MTIIPGLLVPTIPLAIASYETTSKNTEPSGQVEVATFANGCFWGTQELFDKYLGPTRGVKTTVGYTGGDEKFKNPTYDQVCSGMTSFAEACKVEYDPALVGYAELILPDVIVALNKNSFIEVTTQPLSIHEPATAEAVQYRSVIFTHSPGQNQIAHKVTDEVQEKYFSPKGLEIVTAIDDAGTWYDAEAYHQKKYLELNPDHGSTHNTLHW